MYSELLQDLLFCYEFNQKEIWQRKIKKVEGLREIIQHNKDKYYTCQKLLRILEYRDTRDYEGLKKFLNLLTKSKKLKQVPEYCLWCNKKAKLYTKSYLCSACRELKYGRLIKKTR